MATKSKSNRVIFCGSRVYDNIEMIRAVFEAVKPTLVITGGCTGADALCDQVAKELGIDRVIYPANWIKLDKAAGPARNARMLLDSRPDLVVAFPGGAGTDDMIKKATDLDIPIKRVKPT